MTLLILAFCLDIFSLFIIFVFNKLKLGTILLILSGILYLIDAFIQYKKEKNNESNINEH